MFSRLKAAKIGDGLGAGACAWDAGAHLERTGAGIYTALLLATLRGYPTLRKFGLPLPRTPTPTTRKIFSPRRIF